MFLGSILIFNPIPLTEKPSMIVMSCLVFLFVFVIVIVIVIVFRKKNNPLSAGGGCADWITTLGVHSSNQREAASKEKCERICKKK